MIKPPPLAPFVRSFFEDYLACRRNVSRHTVLSYRDAVKLFLGFAGRQLKRPATGLLVAELTEELVLAFLADLEQTRRNSIQTRNHRLTALRCLFRYVGSREPALLEHCRRVAELPLKRGAAVPEARYLEKAEVTALLDAVPQGTPRGQRDHALLLFLYNTGARVQEAADARVGWLTLRPPCKVELLGKGRKWRSCPLWDSTAQQLQRLLEGRRPPAGAEDHLFVNRHGRPLSRSGIADILGRHARKASGAVPSLGKRPVTPHTMRHTTAMHLLQSGVEVNVIRAWLGHVSLATTNRYIEIDLAMKAKALEACEVGAGSPAAPSWRASPDILAWLESL